MKIDKIYKITHSEISDFEFDESVANVFDDMLDRSVPGYRTILSMLTTLSHQYAKPNTNVFDLDVPWVIQHSHLKTVLLIQLFNL